MKLRSLMLLALTVGGFCLQTSVGSAIPNVSQMKDSGKCDQDSHPDHKGSCQLNANFSALESLFGGSSSMEGLSELSSAMNKETDKAVDAESAREHENMCSQFFHSCLELSDRGQGQASIGCINFYRDTYSCNADKLLKELGL